VNFKPVVFTCAITFVLSFLVALISGAGFGISFLRAIILTLCFGALSVGISFLFYKFLNDGSSVISSSDSQNDQNLPPIGNKVDITINDEDLQEDDFSPKFVLTGQNQMLNEDDVKNVKSGKADDLPAADLSLSSQGQELPVEEESNLEEKRVVKPELAVNTNSSQADAKSNSQTSNENSATSFKPVPLAKTAVSSEDFAGQFPDIENTLGEKSILKSNSISENDVDVLPDMGGTPAGLKDDTVTDSEFASAGKESFSSGISHMRAHRPSSLPF